MGGEPAEGDILKMGFAVSKHLKYASKGCVNIALPTAPGHGHAIREIHATSHHALEFPRGFDSSFSVIPIKLPVLLAEVEMGEGGLG